MANASKLLQKEPKQIVLNSASSEDELCPEWTTALRLSLLLTLELSECEAGWEGEEYKSVVVDNVGF